MKYWKLKPNLKPTQTSKLVATTTLSRRKLTRIIMKEYCQQPVRPLLVETRRIKVNTDRRLRIIFYVCNIKVFLITNTVIQPWNRTDYSVDRCLLMQYCDNNVDLPTGIIETNKRVRKPNLLVGVSLLRILSLCHPIISHG
jgi:hypothetical protein